MMSVHQVQPQDASFLYIDAENRHTHVSVIWIYDPAEASGGRISLEDMRQHMASRLQVTPIFHQKLVRVPMDLDYPYWVDVEEVDFSYHVREVRLRAPGDWPRFLKTVSKIHSQPLDLDKPLWEMHLVQGLNVDWLPQGAFAVIFKIHHVALDGATGMAVLQGLHDAKPGAISGAGAEYEPGPSANAPALYSMLSAAAANHVNYSIKSVKTLASMAARIPRLLSTVRLRSLLDSSEAPETLFNQDVSPDRVVDYRCFEFEQIRQIRNAVPGATINDVVLTLCGGALRRFLESKGELPDDSMVAVCPINVRTREEAESGGNRIAIMTSKIHTEIADPLERLKAVHRSTRRSKAVVDSIGARNIQELNNALPSLLQTLAIAAVDGIPQLPRLPRAFNCSISNLPGPSEPLYLGGAKLLQSGAGMPVGNGYGLFIGICAYAGIMSFNITSARNILPHTEELMVQFEHSFAELRKAADADKEPVRRKRPRSAGISRV